MSRGKLVELSEVRLAPVADVVAALEDLLSRAQSGELRGFVIGGAADRGCDFSAHCIGDGTISVLLLGLERAKLRLLQEGE